MSLADNITAIKTMLGLARFTKKRGLKAAAYKAAGLYLERLRKGRTKAEWVDLVQVNCDLSVSRAYELMAVASGSKSIAETRATTAARRRAHYARKSRGSVVAHAPQSATKSHKTPLDTQKSRARSKAKT
jgi:hypothetical protein